MTYKPTHTKTGKPIVHGLYTTYCNHGCRCDECREAQRVAVKEWRQRTGDRRGRLQADAYHAAEVRLRETHRTEFDALYKQERQRRGLDSQV